MAYEKVKYNNDYNREAYDRASINFPKGKKSIIEEHWKSKGYKSLNAYVNDLIDRDMQGTPGINVNNNKGIVAGNIHGDISMK